MSALVPLVKLAEVDSIYIAPPGAGPIPPMAGPAELDFRPRTELLSDVLDLGTPAVSAVTSAGRARHGATAWHDAGITGTGVKVGVIDTQFKDFDSLMGSELPAQANVHVRCYTGALPNTVAQAQLTTAYSASLSDCPDGGTHGTASAEVLYDMAPGAEFYISNPRNRFELEAAAQWMSDEGVSVITRSVVSPWLTSGDGQSTTYVSSVKTVTDLAMEPIKAGEHVTGNGVVWANGAGNFARTTWYSGSTALSAVGSYAWFVDFDTGSGTDNCNEFRLGGDDEIGLHFRWDGVYYGSNIDLEVQLRKGDSLRSLIQGRSTPTQSGTGSYPLDYLYHSVGSGQSTEDYCVSIQRTSGGSDPSWMQLSTYSLSDVSVSFEERSSARSIAEPSDARSGNLISVGAVRQARIGLLGALVLENYSSRGPTRDGRSPKPEVLGLTGVGTSNRGTYHGTSAATPHVAGLAALARQRFPSLTATQVVYYLTSNAEQQFGLGSPNNSWGYGFAELPGLTEPNNILVSVISGDGPRITVSYDRSQWDASDTHVYQFRIRSTTGDVTPVTAPRGTRAVVNPAWNLLTDLYTSVPTTASTSVSVSIGDLTVGRSYAVQGRRCATTDYVSCSAWSDWSDPVYLQAGTTPLPVLSAPPALSSVSAGSPSRTSINVTWSAVSGATKYRVQYRRGSSGAWSTPTSDAIGTGHRVRGLSCGTTYQFQVAAYGDGDTYAEAWGAYSSPPSSASTNSCRLNPIFVPSSFSFGVPEDASSGDVVGTLTARDPDGTDSLMRYSITGGNSAGKFSLDSVTGVITLTEDVSTSDPASFQLTVQVRDAQNLTDTATVRIRVLKVIPMFSAMDYEIHVVEGASVGQEVGTVVAMDPDAADNLLRYSITGGISAGKFGLDSVTGVITLAQTIGAEDPTSYSLTVQVTDRDSRTDTATVVVLVVTPVEVLLDHRFLTGAEGANRNTVRIEAFSWGLPGRNLVFPLVVEHQWGASTADYSGCLKLC